MINYSTCMRGNPTDKDAAQEGVCQRPVLTSNDTGQVLLPHCQPRMCILARRYPSHPYSCRGLPARAVVERTADTDGRSGRIFEQYPKLGAHSMAEFTVENITR